MILMEPISVAMAVTGATRLEEGECGHDRELNILAAQRVAGVCASTGDSEMNFVIENRWKQRRIKTDALRSTALGSCRKMDQLGD